MSSQRSKLIEYERYNKRSEENLKKLNSENIHLRLGAKSLPEFLQSPYIKYEELIREYATQGKALLDVCCGDGMHSLAGAGQGAEIHVSDISEKSVELVINKGKFLGYDIQGIAADAEKLPHSDNSFDIITCAGSLSYVDLNAFMNEVDRILRPGGVFICVDSFNHNPIYKFNRFVHFLKGNRTWTVNSRIPNLTTLQKIKSHFINMKVSYYGIFSFLAPFLALFLDKKKVKRQLDKLDHQFFFLKKYSFKIVIIATKKI
jgi:ubiquinone/menaquinone biosynthesis C-methylase UbiE